MVSYMKAETQKEIEKLEQKILEDIQLKCTAIEEILSKGEYMKITHQSRLEILHSLYASIEDIVKPGNMSQRRRSLDQARQNYYEKVYKQKNIEEEIKGKQEEGVKK